jgi:hypothetical protein
MLRAVLALLIAAPLTSAAAFAETRIALLVTNQAYRQPGAALANTHRDGEILEAALEKVGFRVWVARDTANEGALLKAIGEHVQRLTAAGSDAVGFFYYSGHGAADRPNGENFLIPTEVPLTHTAELPLMAVRLERILSTLTAATPAAPKGCIGRKRWRLARSSRTALVFTTCTGMYGSGFRIAGTQATRVHRSTAQPGRAAIAACVCAAVVLGTPIRGVCAQLCATGMQPAAASTAAGSAWLERSIDGFRGRDRGQTQVLQAFLVVNNSVRNESDENRLRQGLQPGPNLDRQIAALRAGGCNRIFREKVSGAGHSQPPRARQGDRRAADQGHSGDRRVG